MSLSAKLFSVGACVVAGVPLIHAQFFHIDLTAVPPATSPPVPPVIELQPNLDNQSVEIFVSVTGSDAISRGLDPAFTIHNGVTLAPAIIKGYNFLGTPYDDPGAGLNGGLSYSITPTSTFFTSHTTPNGKEAVFPGASSPGAVSKLITLVFNTTGVGPGTWSFTPTQGAFSFMVIDANVAYPLTYTAGTLVIVPETEFWAIGTGLGLVAFAGYRRRR